MLAVSCLYFWKRDALSAELAISVIASIAGFFHFLYSQHSANTDRFIALFRDFNLRFDALNDRLNVIRAKGPGELLTSSEQQCLCDYFNLCAEEYRYFKSGYLDREVWMAWQRGMDYFAESKEIRRFWESELEQGSYYGFSLGMLRNAA